MISNNIAKKKKHIYIALYDVIKDAHCSRKNLVESLTAIKDCEMRQKPKVCVLVRMRPIPQRMQMLASRP